MSSTRVVTHITLLSLWMLFSAYASATAIKAGDLLGMIIPLLLWMGLLAYALCLAVGLRRSLLRKTAEPPSPIASTGFTTDALCRLAETGAITPAEFEKAKNKLLNAQKQVPQANLDQQIVPAKQLPPSGG